MTQFCRKDYDATVIEAKCRFIGFLTLGFVEFLWVIFGLTFNFKFFANGFEKFDEGS